MGRLLRCCIQYDLSAELNLFSWYKFGYNTATVYKEEVNVQDILLVIHVLLAIFLVMLILLQQGKGASMASNLTGSTGSAQSVFGSQGAGGFMLKLTGFVALLFFVSTLTLNYMSHHQGASHKSVVDSAQKISQQQKMSQEHKRQHQIQHQLRPSHQHKTSSSPSNSAKQSQSSASQSNTSDQKSKNPAVMAAQKQLNADKSGKQTGSSTSSD